MLVLNLMTTQKYSKPVNYIRLKSQWVVFFMFYYLNNTAL
ncbi:hypothetical protein AO385_0190 [Moraxella catarrhalis]|uniref:Uncharacterized protein n=1 Tax=Moraxella catarrhalis TaxID=480 RepID=A0A198UE87_MORCA|nr:hypothetical protein AO383_2207 [Moraxella catarrhalis]OAU94731.1 hypothetical protein AO384_2088 [Moraxella catarrhalis]OAV04127.1 hypothetical protein AO385_0190 [Moraxella catarrhalis]